MITAEEARQRVDDMATKRGKELLAKLESAIESAVDLGKTSVSIDIEHQNADAAAKWLENLGYRVQAGYCQREGSWFVVEW